MKRKATHASVTYFAGCKTCHGMATCWRGKDAKVEAERHYRDTQHAGVWYERETRAVFQISEPEECPQCQQSIIACLCPLKKKVAA